MRSRVVECRLTADVDTDPSTDRADLPNQLMRAAMWLTVQVRDHEVDDLADRLLTEKPGHQDVGVWQVHLLRTGGAQAPNGESAATRTVEQGPEHSWRI